MYYLPLKQKENFTHIADSIAESIDRILKKKCSIASHEIKQLFLHVNFLEVCAYKMFDDTDFMLNPAITERDLIFGLTTSGLLNSGNQELIWVFVNNLQDIIDLSKEWDDFLELNQYIYEVLNSDRN